MKFLHAMAVAAVAAVWALPASAGDAGRNFQVKNRIRAEYDDNIYETSSGEQESMKIVEELEFLVNLNLEQSFIGLRYRPTFVWWDKREPDDTDLHHDLDLILTHNFSPRVAISLKDTMRFAEQPQQIDRGTAIRERDDYKYNVADGLVTIALRPVTHLEVGARHTMLRYDRDEVAQVEDYDIYAGGATLRHELSPSLTLAGEARYETTDYDGPDRGADSEFIGVGVERIFSPNLLGSLRGGIQLKQFGDSAIDDESAPYVDGSLTFLPTPQTRLTAGLGYSMFESDVFPYANQDRTLVYVSAAHDLTARISLFAAASYQLGDYSADQSIDPTFSDGTTVEDGQEEVLQFSARGSYKINRNNSVELGWQHLTVNSDLATRDDYDRNRVEVGWRTQI